MRKVDKKVRSVKQRDDFLFSLYNLLYEQDAINTYTKGRALEAAASGFHDSHWRVISITKKALLHIYEHRDDPGKARSGLRRGHHGSGRHNRSKILFESRKLSREKFIAYFYRHDPVTIVTIRENAKPGTAGWSKQFQVNEGHFSNPGGYAVCVRKRTEIPWVAELVERKKLASRKGTEKKSRSVDTSTESQQLPGR